MRSVGDLEFPALDASGSASVTAPAILRRLAWVAAAVLPAIFAGCATQPSTQPEASDKTGTPPAGIYDTSSGDRLSVDELARRLSARTFVVFGERHDSAWQHRRQAKLFRALVRRRGDVLSLGMEMFQRPFQPPLDAYVAGRIDESEMLERTEWEERWGFPPTYYQPLWRTARDGDIPVVALNLRRELSRKIARTGLEGLSDAERDEIPETVDTSIDAQREYVRRAFDAHDMSKHMSFEHFLQAQAAWDETMAETAVEFVRARETVEAMFIVAGRAHARKDFGIPARLRRRLADETSSKAIASVIPVTSERASQTSARRDDTLADYVWIGSNASSDTPK